jgi:hypothetical protein
VPKGSPSQSDPDGNEQIHSVEGPSKGHEDEDYNQHGDCVGGVESVFPADLSEVSAFLILLHLRVSSIFTFILVFWDLTNSFI